MDYINLIFNPTLVSILGYAVMVIFIGGLIYLALRVLVEAVIALLKALLVGSCVYAVGYLIYWIIQEIIPYLTQSTA